MTVALPDTAPRPDGARGAAPRVTTLDNGLRVVTDPVPTVESATVGVWVGGGTRHEPEAANGVAHLLEHMAFKGTGRRSAQRIAEEIEAVGGLLNAYTTREHTAYYAKVLKEDVPLALDVLADMLQHSVLDEAELARERQVVVQEIHQAHDTPDDIVFDRFQAAAFPGQPLGRSVLGTVDSVEALGRPALADFLGGHYGARDLVVAAAGRVEHDALVEAVVRLFDALPDGGRGHADVCAYAGGEHREPRDLEQLHLIVGFPGVGYHAQDYYALSVLATLLGGGMSSRLFQEIREKAGLAYAVHSFTSAYVDGGLFGVYAGTGGESAGELVPLLCDQLLAVAHRVGAEEIASAKAQLRASLLMGLESTTARCEQAGQHMLVFGRPLTPQEMVDRLDAVDEAAVRRVAAKTFSAPPTVAALGQTGELEPYDRLAARLA